MLQKIVRMYKLATRLNTNILDVSDCLLCCPGWNCPEAVQRVQITLLLDDVLRDNCFIYRSTDCFSNHQGCSRGKQWLEYLATFCDHNSLYVICMFAEENDYSLAIYVGDGFLFLALLISTKLKVTLRPETDAADDAKSTKDHDKKNEEQQRRKETRNALLKIINPTTLIFFGLVFTNGLVRGVDGTYVSLYLQDELGASSQLLGKHFCNAL